MSAIVLYMPTGGLIVSCLSSECMQLFKPSGMYRICIGSGEGEAGRHEEYYGTDL